MKVKTSAAFLVALALSVFPLAQAGAQQAASPPAQGQQQGQGQSAPAATPNAAASPPAAPAAAPAGTAPHAGEAAPAPAPKPAPVPPDPTIVAAREKMEAARSALDSIDAALAVEGLRPGDLDELRQRLDPARKDLAAVSDQIAPRVADAESRLSGLGPKPADGATEEPTVAADRERLTKISAELGAVLKQNRALVLRGDQISDRISARRRALFTGQLFERVDSVIDPDLWTSAFNALSGEFRALSYFGNDWRAYSVRRLSPLAVIGIVLGGLAIMGAVVAGGSLLRKRLRTPAPAEGESFTRLRSAREAMKVLFLNATVAPAAAMAAIAFIGAFEIIPPRAEELVQGIVIAIFIKAIGNAVGRAFLAPNEPWRRLPPLSDGAAVLAFRYYSFTVWTLAIAAALNALHRVLFAPVGLTVVTSAIMSLLIAGFISRFLVGAARAEANVEAAKDTTATDAAAIAATGPAPAPPRYIRLFVWVAVFSLIGALVAGYISFAAFVAARMVIAAAVLGVLYLLYALIDAFFGEGLSAETHRARMISSMLGLKPERVELIGVLASGLLKLQLFIIAAFLIVGSWGTSTADMMETVERVSFGVRIGNATITLWSVVYAVLLLLVSLAAARGLQKWVSSALLPRTGLEPSLQSSISTIVGYVGTIIAVMVAMGQLGLNLENIALVAGALSVGIGFGLQSVVSNFVSGLILLAERPIRVGDTINVKGEEGYVRRISVRSTEIETFERATVIVPNADLITGMVKNWTHSNTTGRIIVAVTVSYDSDPEEVRDILVACACDHPQVLQTPPPRVFLMKFADAGIVFELRCVVANVDYALTVKSDLHFQVLSRFRKAKVGMVAQPWAALARAPRDMVPPPPSPPDPLQ